MTTLFKFLSPGGVGPYSGEPWHKPVGNRPGEWMPKAEPVLCESGYHLTGEQHLLDWLDAKLYVAEGRGRTVVGDNKVVFEQARLLRRVDTWNERTQRLFAADCAEHVLPLFEKRHPDDMRPRRVIEVARRFAAGDVTRDDLDAARAAAWAVARAAAWDAARDAAQAAHQAAWAAAHAAAWDAERQWQQTRLMQYLNGEWR